MAASFSKQPWPFTTNKVRNLPQEVGRRRNDTKEEELEHRHPVDHQRRLISCQTKKSSASIS